MSYFMLLERKHPMYSIKCSFYCTLSICIYRFQFQTISLVVSRTHTNLYSFIPLFIMNVCLYFIYANLNNFFSPKNCEIVFVFCLLAVFSDGVIKEKSRIWIHEF